MEERKHELTKVVSIVQNGGKSPYADHEILLSICANSSVTKSDDRHRKINKGTMHDNPFFF